MNQRDFIGYGASPPQVEWPGKARIAVSVVVNYEEGAEYSILDGDSQGETMGEVPSPVPPGRARPGQRVLLRIRKQGRGLANSPHFPPAQPQEHVLRMRPGPGTQP